MPIISTFFGIVIRMHFLDHAPPHFHAIYAGSHASLRIDPIGILQGELPPRALGLVIEWARLHRQELEADWERARRAQPLDSIPPLG